MCYPTFNMGSVKCRALYIVISRWNNPQPTTTGIPLDSSTHSIPACGLAKATNRKCNLTNAYDSAEGMVTAPYL